SRVIASRVSKILGQSNPQKTPPGSYQPTKLSAGTPKPKASSGGGGDNNQPQTPRPNDKTLPLPIQSEPRISALGSAPNQIPVSSPMASTPVPGALTNPNLAGGGESGGSGRTSTNPDAATLPAPPKTPLFSDNVSALAVSNAKQQKPKISGRVFGILAA